MSCPSLHKCSGQLLELLYKDCLAMNAKSVLHTEKCTIMHGSLPFEQHSNLPSKGTADELGCLDNSR